MSESGALALARSPHLRNLTSLNLEANSIGAAARAEIAAAWDPQVVRF